jgi:hypothetical protein
MPRRSGASRRTWLLPLAALIIGLGGGGLLTGLLRRAGEVVGYLDLASGAQVVSARGAMAPLPRDGALRRGQRVQAVARPARVSLAGGGTITLQPQARLTLSSPAAARLDGGVAIIDTTTVVREIRIETAAGRLVLTAAKVDLRASVSLPATATAGPAFAYLHVESGSARLETSRGTLTVEEEEGALMVAGRAPVRRPDPDGSAGLSLSWPAPVVEPPPPPPEPEPVFGAGLVVPIAVPVAAEGSITGTVELEGPPPAEGSRTVACATAGPPAWDVAAGRVAGVYVHISSAVTASPRLSLPAAQVAQRGCAVVPRVLAVLEGQRVMLEAGDGAGHGARITHGGQIVFEARLGLGGQPAFWTAGHEGFYGMRCDLHPEAMGTVAVSPHPYFAVTGSDGTFVIGQVPPGRHTLTAWHERGGEKSVEVTVVPGRPASVRFRYGGEPVVSPVVAAIAPVSAAEVAVPAPGLVAVAAPSPEPPPPPVRPGITECEFALTGTSPVVRACAEGGVERAAGLMKQIVATARDRGERVRCQSCHHRVSQEPLPGAREQLDRLLAGPPIVYIARPMPLPARAPVRRSARTR